MTCIELTLVCVLLSLVAAQGDDPGSCTRTASQDMELSQLLRLRTNCKVFGQQCSEWDRKALLGETERFAADSCEQIASLKPCSPSGYYWVNSSASGAVRVFCLMGLTQFQQDGGWMRVARVNTSKTSSQCPQNFTAVTRFETTPPLRLCQRVGTQCTSTFFPTHGVQYSRVCGRVTGYQLASPDGFCPSQAVCLGSPTDTSIDGGYVDGISITHGSGPRNHIWTFAAGLGFVNYEGTTVCPCFNPQSSSVTVPSYVGNDYYCETGNQFGAFQVRFYSEDPLWDANGCTGASTCCDGEIKPYFCKTLPSPTTDDVEFRVCLDQDSNDEDILLQLIELYVQ